MMIPRRSCKVTRGGRSWLELRIQRLERSYKGTMELDHSLVQPFLPMAHHCTYHHCMLCEGNIDDLKGKSLFPGNYHLSYWKLLEKKKTSAKENFWKTNILHISVLQIGIIIEHWQYSHQNSWALRALIFILLLQMWNVSAFCSSILGTKIFWSIFNNNK